MLAEDIDISPKKTYRWPTDTCKMLKITNYWRNKNQNYIRISPSNCKKACIHAKLLQSCPTLCHPMAKRRARQALLSMESSRQEYWSGKSFPSPWNFPNSCTKHRFPALQEDSLPSESPGKPSKETLLRNGKMTKHL